MLTMLNDLQLYNAQLETRFHAKLQVNPRLTRQWVSFQANKDLPTYRWYKYKEGFSEALVEYIFNTLNIKSGTILDPFAGVGTTLFTSSHRGLKSVGIELLPLGNEVIELRSLVENGSKAFFVEILQKWRSELPWRLITPRVKFSHLRITNGAFPDETEQELSQYLTAILSEAPETQRILRFAALCVLEEISYTRKDGQYLRWDYRSGRRQGDKVFNKGEISSFKDAITKKFSEMIDDLASARFLPGLFDSQSLTADITLFQGSCLEILPSLQTSSLDGIITSPPYANRYDYTRTYALELAFLGIGEDAIKALRQTMISCTVENKDKDKLNLLFNEAVYDNAVSSFMSQPELHKILDYLEEQKNSKQLNNPGIPRMLRNYFLELSLIIFDAARILKPNAPFVMVNDNVRYGGANIPVDLILSSIAEDAGFEVEVIWVLPTGKGNSSQQMGAHGREELRKCVYVWRRKE